MVSEKRTEFLGGFHDVIVLLIPNCGSLLVASRLQEWVGFHAWFWPCTPLTDF